MEKKRFGAGCELIGPGDAFNSPGWQAGDRSAACASFRPIPGLAAWAVIGVLVMWMLSPAQAFAGEMKDNPNYKVWANFKPGSTVTVTADIRDGDDNVHIETTRTLVSVTADELVVKSVSTMKKKGKLTTQVPVNQTIKAKTDSEEIKETGSKDMDAMGRTFKCRVWDSAGAKPATPAVKGQNKLVGPESMKATIYVSDQVPGGVVRLDGVGPNGQSVTFVLTSFEVK